MTGMLSTLRASALFMAVVVIACLPQLAVHWITSPAHGAPRFADPAAHPTVTHGDAPPALPFPPSPPGQEPPPVYDLRGNEIVRPVERYSIDHRGTLYELHSPQTEIPRLGPPEL